MSVVLIELILALTATSDSRIPKPAKSHANVHKLRTQTFETSTIERYNYRDYLQARIAAAKSDRLPASVLFKEIRSQSCNSRTTTFRDFVRTIKPEPPPD